jgi:hypothetical protein
MIAEAIQSSLDFGLLRDRNPACRGNFFSLGGTILCSEINKALAACYVFERTVEH